MRVIDLSHALEVATAPMRVRWFVLRLTDDPEEQSVWVSIDGGPPGIVHWEDALPEAEPDTALTGLLVAEGIITPRHLMDMEQTETAHGEGWSWIVDWSNNWRLATAEEARAVGLIAPEAGT